MVRAGEESGALPNVLKRLGDYLEAQDALAAEDPVGVRVSRRS